MLLYKPYNIFLENNQPKTSKLVFIQDKIIYLEKAIRKLQSLVKITPFYPLPHYKTLQWDRKQDEQY